MGLKIDIVSVEYLLGSVDCFIDVHFVFSFFTDPSPLRDHENSASSMKLIRLITKSGCTVF